MIYIITEFMYLSKLYELSIKSLSPNQLEFVLLDPALPRPVLSLLLWNILKVCDALLILFFLGEDADLSDQSLFILIFVFLLFFLLGVSDLSDAMYFLEFLQLVLTLDVVHGLVPLEELHAISGGAQVYYGRRQELHILY